IDLNQAFNGTLPCFSNFVALTETSHNNQNTLKDLAVGQLNSCGTIRIHKNTVPAGSSASFGYSADGPNGATNLPSSFSLSDGGTQTVADIPNGTYHFTEGSKAGWTLTGLSCSNATGDTTSTHSTGGVIATVKLAVGGSVDCTYTNTQQATLTVNKVCVPANDAGKFNLQIDGGTAGTGANAACGGSTGAVVETVGSHTVGETAGTGTSLSDYTSVIGGDCVNGSVTLAAGDSKVCTITNTHKATLTVNKVCVPANDAGKFNLQIDGGRSEERRVGDGGGSTGAAGETEGSD